MQVKVLKRFVDGRGVMVAPGMKLDVDSKEAAALIAQGRAASFSGSKEERKISAAEKPEAGTGELPEDFPERDRLIEAGYDTLESLDGVGDALLEIDGIGKASLKKIQKALKEV